MHFRWRDFALAILWLVLDQATKAWASAHFEDPVTVVPGFLRFILSHNRGALFGWLGNLADPWRTIALTGLPLLAIVGILVLLLYTGREEIFGRVGLAIVLGGAIGNVLDRLTYGHVVDFIDVYADWWPASDLLTYFFRVNRWPTFNIADAGLTCGAALLLYEVFVRRKPHKETVGASVPD